MHLYDDIYAFVFRSLENKIASILGSVFEFTLK